MNYFKLALLGVMISSSTLPLDTVEFTNLVESLKFIVYCTDIDLELIFERNKECMLYVNTTTEQTERIKVREIIMEGSVGDPFAELAPWTRS